MSIADIDRQPRMQSYMKAEDMNLDGCILLASTILADAAEDYIQCSRALKRYPDDIVEENHMRNARRFYHSDYFKVLSLGAVDGDAVMRELDKQV